MSDLTEIGILTSVTAVGAVGLRWVAGPSLKNIGNAFGEWVDLRSRNVLGIGSKIQNRVDLEQESGSVHPRVLHDVIAAGSWADDDVMQEYYAGILIGSHSVNEALDDRGARWAARISNLSTFEVRAHWVVYSAALRIWNDQRNGRPHGPVSSGSPPPWVLMRVADFEQSRRAARPKGIVNPARIFPPTGIRRARGGR